MTELVWLVERGQAVGHSPTVWWIASPEPLWSREGEAWTQDAFKATRFPTREAAQDVIDHLFTSFTEVTARAVEHGFIGAPGVFEKMDAVRERLAVRSTLDPAHADWMRTRLEAVLATLKDATVTYGIIGDDGSHTPMMVERDAIVEALYGT